MINDAITLIVAATALLGSPGPAPLALSATGAAFGVNKGLSFLGGILLGLTLSISLVAAGLTSLLETQPTLALILTLVGAAYVLYLAFKIAKAPAIGGEQSAAHIPSFFDGLVLSITNPKAYAAFFALFTQFRLALDNALYSAIATAAIIMLVVSIIDFLWLAAGGLLRPLFSNEKSSRAIRLLFAGLMVATVAWVVIKTNW